MEEYTDALYRSLSEYKLKQKVQRASGKIIVENGQLMPVSYTHLDVYKRQEYMYAFISRDKGKAFVIIRMNNGQKAAEVLKERGFDILSPETLYNM